MNLSPTACASGLLLAGSLCLLPALASGGVILSEKVSVGTRSGPPVPAHENLLDSMDVFSLSPSARLLAQPCPMVRPELALAMRRGMASPSPEEWKAIIRKAAGEHRLPEALIAAIIRTESDFRADAVSAKGAQGAMQIMPQTQRELGLADPYDVESNVMAGCAYLRKQMDLFGSRELALAAYNAGPGNVRRFGGVPPFPETRDYIRKVTSLADGLQSPSRLAEERFPKER